MTTFWSHRAPAPCHSRVTHSRNQADTGGHRRTRRRSHSSTGGTSRTPQDTRGHGIARVRDREAPGSNPGPPTIFEFKIGDYGCSPAPSGHGEITDTAETPQLTTSGHDSRLPI